MLGGVQSVYYIFGIPVFIKRTPGLTANQLSEWEAYDKMDPMGDWRHDFRMAFLSSLINNIVTALYADKKKSVKYTTPKDFMPNWGGEGQTEEKQSVDDMKAILLAIAKAQNSKVQKGK